MKDTLNHFEDGFRTVDDNKLIGKNILVMNEYIDEMKLDEIKSITRSKREEYYKRFVRLQKQALAMFIDVNNKEIISTGKVITDRCIQSFLKEKYPDQITMDISALETND
jgi:hypothetical protein